MHFTVCFIFDQSQNWFNDSSNADVFVFGIASCSFFLFFILFLFSRSIFVCLFLPLVYCGFCCCCCCCCVCQCYHLLFGKIQYYVSFVVFVVFFRYNFFCKSVFRIGNCLMSTTWMCVCVCNGPLSSWYLRLSYRRCCCRHSRHLSWLFIHLIIFS